MRRTYTCQFCGREICFLKIEATFVPDSCPVAGLGARWIEIQDDGGRYP